MEKYNRLYDNIYIITNLYEWDKNGKAIEILAENKTKKLIPKKRNSSVS